MYWWNEDIAKLRRNRQEAENIPLAFKSRRKELHKAIQDSKNKSFKLRRDDLQNNPWGNAYKIVMTKIKGINSKAPTCPVMMENIVLRLFPQHEAVDLNKELECYAEVIRIVTALELENAAEKLKSKNAAAIDGIPNYVLKLAFEEKPEMVCKVYIKCLEQGMLPIIWKIQRLVLIPKGNKPPELPSSHRPLCMLDSAGKALEITI